MFHAEGITLFSIMKEYIVIQCSASKKHYAKTFKTQNGRVVKFVAHPRLCSPTNSHEIFCRPDDAVPDNPTIRWRQYLTNYNNNYRIVNANPAGLLAAGNLYKPKEYELLLKRYGLDMFILSAGWGLVRADFLLPAYDVTFSSAPAVDIGKKRKRDDYYDDYNQLASVADADSSIYFLGGKSYLPIYYKLTKDITAKKVIYHISESVPEREGYHYIRYANPKSRSTNWHYDCAVDFINGRVSK